MGQPQIERVLRLMLLMSSNNNYTVNELSEKIETSPRSIYRYIDTFKNAGFVVNKLSSNIYKLGKENKYIKDFSSLINFSEEEATIVNRLIDALDNTNVLKQNLRSKLASFYDCTSLANCVVKGKNAINVNRITDAITSKKQVILKNYASSHTGIIRDKPVEAFAFTTNNVQIWCFDLENRVNKLFNTERIESVMTLDTEWQNSALHKIGLIDIFRISGDKQFKVNIELNVMSHNLLIEEFPLAEREVKQLDTSHWLLETKVCSLEGIGRFVLGLANNIRVINSPELSKYLSEKVKNMNFNKEI